MLIIKLPLGVISYRPQEDTIWIGSSAGHPHLCVARNGNDDTVSSIPLRGVDLPAQVMMANIWGQAKETERKQTVHTKSVGFVEFAPKGEADK